MTTLRPLLIILVAVVTGFHASDGVAAKAKKWEKLAACQYVEDNSNRGQTTFDFLQDYKFDNRNRKTQTIRVPTRFKRAALNCFDSSRTASAIV